MRKNDDIYNLLESLGRSASPQTMSKAELKFNLFLKSRELKQISLAFQRVMLKERAERELWVEENQSVMENLLKVFAEDSSLSLDGIQLDDETALLSVELAENLKKTVSIINTLFYGVDDLKS